MITYENFAPHTQSILNRFIGALRGRHSMDDLRQESWIVFLETGETISSGCTRTLLLSV